VRPVSPFIPSVDKLVVARLPLRFRCGTLRAALGRFFCAFRSIPRSRAGSTLTIVVLDGAAAWVGAHLLRRAAEAYGRGPLELGKILRIRRAGAALSLQLLEGALARALSGPTTGACLCEAIAGDVSFGLATSLGLATPMARYARDSRL